MIMIVGRISIEREVVRGSCEGGKRGGGGGLRRGRRDEDREGDAEKRRWERRERRERRWKMGNDDVRIKNEDHEEGRMREACRWKNKPQKKKQTVKKK